MWTTPTLVTWDTYVMARKTRLRSLLLVFISQQWTGLNHRVCWKIRILRFHCLGSSRCYFTSRRFLMGNEPFSISVYFLVSYFSLPLFSSIVILFPLLSSFAFKFFHLYWSLPSQNSKFCSNPKFIYFFFFHSAFFLWHIKLFFCGKV